MVIFRFRFVRTSFSKKKKKKKCSSRSHTLSGKSSVAKGVKERTRSNGVAPFTVCRPARSPIMVPRTDAPHEDIISHSFTIDSHAKAIITPPENKSVSACSLRIGIHVYKSWQDHATDLLASNLDHSSSYIQPSRVRHTPNEDGSHGTFRM